MKNKINYEKSMNKCLIHSMVNEVYARYKDDGPNGICGQSCSTTCHWDKLFIFPNEGIFREWVRSLEFLNSRCNPRIDGHWINTDYSNDICDMR